MKTYITFHYNDLGRSNLVIYKDGEKINSFPARTGSVHEALCNPIKQGVWYIKTPHEKTTEKGMMIEGFNISWKTRLYNSEKEYTRYLIHPDGNKPGSLGCIVTPGMELELRDLIDSLLKEVDEIPVYVNVSPR